jgi:hypothetical protein
MRQARIRLVSPFGVVQPYCSFRTPRLNVQTVGERSPEAPQSEIGLASGIPQENSREKIEVDLRESQGVFKVTRTGRRQPVFVLVGWLV